MISRVGIIGFGEVGQRLASDLQRAGVADITAWDIAFEDKQSDPAAALDRISVREAPSAQEAASGADLVICAVTAAQTVEAARATAAGMDLGAFFLDLNSASPSAKQEAASTISCAEARYVEAAVMSPIAPRGIGSPMLLGGEYANDLLKAAGSLGFSKAIVYSREIGTAAATKLCRSVMIKGIEALLTEAMLAARHYGVEKTVLESLSDLLPLPDWESKAQYMISRSLEHGARRAEEMREAALTVAEAGVEPLMCRAIVERQDWAAAHRKALSPELAGMLDTIIKDLGSE